MADLQSMIGDNRVGFIKRLDHNRQLGTWREVRFQPPFGIGTRVIVLAQPQTYRGPDTPGLRVRNVTTKGFEIRYDGIYYTRDQDNERGPHGSNGDRQKAEDVGWIAYAVGRILG